MRPEELKRLLEQVASGTLGIPDALKRLKALPYEDLGFARVDHHRHLRRGFPEVVYAEGKTPAQCAAIVKRLAKTGNPVLVTRANRVQYRAVAKVCRGAVWHESARVITVGVPMRRPSLVTQGAKGDATQDLPAGGGRPKGVARRSGGRRTSDMAGPDGANAVGSPATHGARSTSPASGFEEVLVITAGTSDIPVAEEAALTVETFGLQVGRLFDVGVAGLHRLVAERERMESAKVIIVVAGMEGALPSVVAGMVGTPVIGVPTSVGYGAALGGLTPLFGMLTSCAGGLTVVNIDNGFGAGLAAALLAVRMR